MNLGLFNNEKTSSMYCIEYWRAKMPMTL